MNFQYSSMIMQNYKKYLWLTLLCLVSCNVVDEYTAKNYLTILYGKTTIMRKDISKSLLEKSNIVNQGKIDFNKDEAETRLTGVDIGWVTADGAIILYNQKYDVLFIQEPYVANNEVNWKCTISPKEITIKFCNLKPERLYDNTKL